MIPGEGLYILAKVNLTFLKNIQKHYNKVEIDQWFWSLFDIKKVLLPKDADVKVYTQSVPEKFRFSIKIPNSITLTHFYNRDRKTPLKKDPHFFNPELFQSFLTTLKPMKKTLVCLCSSLIISTKKR